MHLDGKTKKRVGGKPRAIESDVANASEERKTKRKPEHPSYLVF
jgi:hypothetical protein